MTDRTQITKVQWLALALAGGLLTWQCAALIEHAKSMKGMTMVMLAGIPLTAVTVAALPAIAEEVWRRARWYVALPLTVIGLVPAFSLLLAFTILATVGRSGEIRDTRSAEAQVPAAAALIISQELTRAEARLTAATKEVDRACKSAAFTPNCEGWKRTESERTARVTELRRQLIGPDPAKVIGADSRRAAAILGVKVEDVDLYQPLLMPLGMELALWPLVWIGFSHSLRRRAEQVQPDLPAPTRLQIEDEVLSILRGVGRPVSNDELADLLKVSKGQASKLVTERVDAGLLKRERRGREVDIALA